MCSWYHGDMPKPSSKIVALLVEALTLCAKDRELIRRVERAGVHEDMVLSSLGDMAEKAGFPAKMVALHSSTHPLSMREETWQKPLDYRYHVQYFLEVDNRLLKLALKFKGAGKRETLVAINTSKDKVMTASDYQDHQEWSVLDDPMNDREGAEILNCILEGRGFDEALAAIKLDSETSKSQPSRQGPRL